MSLSYAEISSASAACAACAPGEIGEIPVPTVASVGRGCSSLRLAKSRLDTPSTTTSFCCQPRNSPGLRPSNVLSSFMVLVAELLLLELSPILIKQYVAARSGVLYATTTAVVLKYQIQKLYCCVEMENRCKGSFLFGEIYSNYVEQTIRIFGLD